MSAHVDLKGAASTDCITREEGTLTGACGRRVTFYDQVPGAARRSEMVRGDAGVTPSVRFGHVDDSEAPVFRNGNSEIKAKKPQMASSSHTTAWESFLSSLQP